MNNQHGIKQEQSTEDGEECWLQCYCGLDFIGKRSVEDNARNVAYRNYRKHLIKEMKERK